MLMVSVAGCGGGIQQDVLVCFGTQIIAYNRTGRLRRPKHIGGGLVILAANAFTLL